MLDDNGGAFIADTGNNRVIEIKPDGSRVTIGTGLHAPTGVAVDLVGDVFIADSGNNRVVEVTPSGTQTTVASGLNNPQGVALTPITTSVRDQDLNLSFDVPVGDDLVIADSGNNRVLESAPGVAVTVRFPTALAVGASSATAAYGQGVTLTATLTAPLAGSPAPTAADGSVSFYDGTTLLGTAPLLGSPATATLPGVLLPPGRHTIRASYGGDGTFAAVPLGQAVLATDLNFPKSVAADGAGDVFIADTDNNRVVVLPADGAELDIGSYEQFNGVQYTLTSFQGPFAVTAVGPTEALVTDGTGALVAVQLGGTPIQIGYGIVAPPGQATDGQGDVFIADPAHDQVLELKPDGSVTTVGSGLDQPYGVAVDAAGDVFIADSGNNRVLEVFAGVPVTVSPAPATITITPYNLSYDGNAHTATRTATGIGGIDLSADLTLTATTHTAAGAYIDAWTFHDPSGNYLDASGTVNDSISPANAHPFVTGYSGVSYNGAPYTAVATAINVNGKPMPTSDFNLTATVHTNAGASTDAWSFHDPSGNYQDANGTVSDSIAKANANITVTSYSVKYDGNAHTAPGSATGVETTPANLTGLLHLVGTTHTNATGGTLSDGWTFDGNNNYNAASGTVNDSIAKADAHISVTGYSVQYDGNAHTATGSASGVESTPANLASLLHLAGTTHTNATGGTVSDSWIFDGNSNYNPANGAVNDLITKVALAITANNATKVPGQANPAFTVTYSGFVHGEGPGVLGGKLSFNVTSTSSTTYAITPLGLTAGNYSIKFVAGTLTVLSYAVATSNLQKEVDAAGLQPSVQAKLDVWFQSANSAFSQASRWGSELVQNRAGAQMLRQLVFEVGSLRGRGISDALADAWIAAAQEIINAVALTT
jgi:hypothetical protein